MLGGATELTEIEQLLVRQMRGRGRFAALGALLFAKMNPGKRAMIVTGTDENARRHREWLAEANGGARPFNVKVKSLESSDSANSARS